MPVVPEPRPNEIPAFLPLCAQPYSLLTRFVETDFLQSFLSLLRPVYRLQYTALRAQQSIISRFSPFNTLPYTNALPRSSRAHSNPRRLSTGPSKLLSHWNCFRPAALKPARCNAHGPTSLAVPCNSRHAPSLVHKRTVEQPQSQSSSDGSSFSHSRQPHPDRSIGLLPCA